MPTGEAGPQVEDDAVLLLLVSPTTTTTALCAETVQCDGGGDEIRQLAHVCLGGHRGHPLQFENEVCWRNLVRDRPLGLIEAPALTTPVFIHVS